jgi:hypothetical protein
VEGYLGAGLVSDVEYVGKEPNRATVTFNKLATRNAERIELFSNSRESETKKDGSFYAAECLRQVSERLPHRPREDGPTHPADTSRSNLALLSTRRLSNPRSRSPAAPVGSRASPPHRPREDGSPTLQTLQDPILLSPWLFYRGGGFPKPFLLTLQLSTGAGEPGLLQRVRRGAHAGV